MFELHYEWIRLIDRLISEDEDQVISNDIEKYQQSNRRLIKTK